MLRLYLWFCCCIESWLLDDVTRSYLKTAENKSWFYVDEPACKPQTVHGLALKYREVFQLGLLDSTDIYTIEEDSDYQTAGMTYTSLNVLGSGGPRILLSGEAEGNVYGVVKFPEKKTYANSN